MTRRLPCRAAGFTLVELLVALSVMAVLALLSWRGIDGLLRTQQMVRERTDQTAVLQTGLAQWTADLEALIAMPPLPALDFDGRVLRLVRVDTSLPGQPLRVVAWSRQVISQAHQGRGSWVRWQSDALRDRQALALAWERAQQSSPATGGPTGGAGTEQPLPIVGLDGWQLLYFRNNAWSNPLSAAGADGAAPVTVPGAGRDSVSPTTTGAAGTPDGIRLVLQLRGPGLSGSLTHDWMRASTPEAP